MATLTPTLTLNSTDAFENQTINLSVTDSLTIQAPMSDISRMATDDNIGNGAGIILAEATSTDTYFIYVKHTGLLASNGTSSSHASNDFVLVSNADGEGPLIKLQPEEFAFFPLNPFDGVDGADAGGDAGGLKVTKGGADVIVEFGYWKRS
jgi:hypothetical protein|tara:strand:- start:226 stop:678 length:453 start_codon:yes stop_codon:yes gene_type:complete